MRSSHIQQFVCAGLLLSLLTVLCGGCGDFDLQPDAVPDPQPEATPVEAPTAPAEVSSEVEVEEIVPDEPKEVKIGNSQAEVEALLGTPRGKMTGGAVEVWTYRVGTVEFENGVVAAVSIMSDDEATLREEQRAKTAAAIAKKRADAKKVAATQRSSVGTSRARSGSSSNADMAKATGLTEEQIRSLQSSFKTSANGEGVRLSASFGMKSLNSRQRPAYRRSGLIPYRISGALYEYKYNSSLKKLVGKARTTGNAEICIIDQDGRRILRQSVSLCKLKPS